MAIASNFPSIKPSLLLDFANVGRLDPRITFTRASTATYFNSLGVLTTANNDVARFDYDPSTLAAQGLLIEEQRTNSIRNNTMVGAVAGTPGTAPTNWSRSASPTSGISNEIVGTGTESGITYIDLRFTGTASATFGFSVNTDSGTAAAASASQAWTGSSYLKLAAGSLNGATVQIVINEYSSVPAFLRNTFSSTIIPTTANLATQRSALSVTTGASTASVQQAFSVGFTNGATYDFTLRIGLPQLELGAFATSVIPTTTTALTRNADVANMTGTNFSSWYNQSSGSMFVEFSLSQPASGGNQFLVRASDNTYNNSVADNINATGFFALATASGGVFDGVATATIAVSANTITKACGAYATNDLAACKDGGAVATDSSATIPTGLTRFDIGSDHAGLNRVKAGYIRRIAYYPVRATNAQLQALTG
jgi:hypothetical protein